MKKSQYVLALALCTNVMSALAVQEYSQDTMGLAGIHDLEQVVVTGNGHHELVKNSTTPVHVMTATDIAKAGITDFQNALIRLVPNVQFAPSAMGSYIRLNGAASDTHIGAHGALTQNANLNIHTGWRMDSIGTYCQE
ncbi:hypothetical protein L6467_00630 [Segatella bryantii]|uniref:hypothetical protein n=1 Tax=Segatella bryantii TaxID=77095 RepID=UPI001EDC06F6|nr:hypothetical protein [Segatella bryantii]UKK72402.1 hypothetical protein L6467_00630 [Segatella bryantii]